MSLFVMSFRKWEENMAKYLPLKEAFSAPESTSRPLTFRLDMFTGFKKLGIINNIGQSIQHLRRFTLTYMRNAGMGKSSMENIIRYELECLIEEFKKGR
ncbi:Haloacid dehalogenase-like hydrolase domain-containing protein 2 [Armadillidium vulgare]|nr:Haloacid dehalogenase-like hydrolase domain-containing protein 2 [Armadillidium vulgare]